MEKFFLPSNFSTSTFILLPMTGSKPNKQYKIKKCRIYLDGTLLKIFSTWDLQLLVLGTTSSPSWLWYQLLEHDPGSSHGPWVQQNQQRTNLETSGLDWRPLTKSAWLLSSSSAFRSRWRTPLRSPLKNLRSGTQLDQAWIKVFQFIDLKSGHFR